MVTHILVIESADRDPNDRFTFPALCGVAVAPVVSLWIKVLVSALTFPQRVDLLRGPEAEAEAID